MFFSSTTKLRESEDQMAYFTVRLRLRLLLRLPRHCDCDSMFCTRRRAETESHDRRQSIAYVYFELLLHSAWATSEFSIASEQVFMLTPMLTLRHVSVPIVG